MAKFDAELGWTHSYRMVLCTCQHHEQSHRPISRKCSICSCAAFVAQKAGNDVQPVPVPVPEKL